MALTFLLLVLGMVFAGERDWFLLLVLEIDLPALAVFFLVDRAERSRA
jgi:hypothetical protein